jgi:hypothetical protein
MTNRLFRAVVVSLAIFVAAGCGGSSNSFTATSVTVTFVGPTPSWAGVQIGDGAFVRAAVEDKQLHFRLGNTKMKYSVAYICGDMAIFGVQAFIIQATGQDEGAFTVSCPEQYGSSPALGSVTGSANATLIPGAAEIFIQPLGDWANPALTSNQGSFDVDLPVGTYDVAVVAADPNGWPLAIKILRSQTVPGAMNRGSPVLFGPSDATTNQPVTVTNGQAAVSVEYETASGAGVNLDGYGPNRIDHSDQYPAVPSTAIRPGDFYVFDVSQDSYYGPYLGVIQTTSRPGPMTIALPTALPCSGMTVDSSTFKFTFNYSGFSDLPATALEARMFWRVGPQTRTTYYVSSMTVDATSNFLNGASTLTVPALVVLEVPFGLPSGSTSWSWDARVYGGTRKQFMGSAFVNRGELGTVSYVGLTTQSCN